MPVVATEIEFYLYGAHGKLSPEYILGSIHEACRTRGIELFSSQQERGEGQYEVAFPCSPDVKHAVTITETFKCLVTEVFAPQGIVADFSAKPLADQPGSGLHVHVHLEDETGRNVFVRNEDAFALPLLHSIGGLLALMNACMPVFAPTPESYRRFAVKSNAPTTVSWGTNNRTVALRLPNKSVDNKHIEHRVAGSDADVAQVINAILAGMHYGLTQRILPSEPVYGDAALAQYNMPLLAQSLEEAFVYQQDMGEVLQEYGLSSV